MYRSGTKEEEDTVRSLLSRHIGEEAAITRIILFEDDPTDPPEDCAVYGPYYICDREITIYDVGSSEVIVCIIYPEF